jgi:Uma2 family endonuclease
MGVIRQQVTLDELLHMPYDGFRYELVRGDLRRTNPAGNVHGRVTMSLAWRLARYVEENQLGAAYAAETGFRLSSNPDTVRAPDVAFVSRDRIEAIGETEGFWPEAPELAVEVVSPSYAFAEVEEKVFDWLDAGTAAFIITIEPACGTCSARRDR